MRPVLPEPKTQAVGLVVRQPKADFAQTGNGAFLDGLSGHNV